MGGDVTIRLNSDGAPGVSHWLERLQMTDLCHMMDDPAVWAPIHRIAGTLDKSLDELFAPAYEQRLSAARQRLLPEDPKVRLLPRTTNGVPIT